MITAYHVAAHAEVRGEGHSKRLFLCLYDKELCADRRIEVRVITGKRTKLAVQQELLNQELAQAAKGGLP